jgi:hypothetical protein
MRGLLALVLLLLPAASSALAAECTSTGFYTPAGEGPLTAAIVNPDKPVTGTLDATGCHIAVYFGPGSSGDVQKAEISGASHFGVVADAGFGSVTVTVTDSSIDYIGESPFTSAQHGIGIYVAAFEPDASAQAMLSRNRIERYQKGGIVVNGPGASAEVLENVVIGLGPVGFIAQNGIQVGYGADVTVARNRIEGNSFTGLSMVASGIVVVGGPGYFGLPYTTGTRIVGNTVLENDIGIFLSNLDEYGLQPQVATNIKAFNNTISKTSLTNAYAGIGYQAGISDVGNGNMLLGNTVAGQGYNPRAYPLAYVAAIDADPTFTARPQASANRN